MLKALTIIPAIEYSQEDCAKGKEWLIDDFLKEVKAELESKIKFTPLKATLGVIYNGIYEDGSYDITGGRGPTGEQSKD